MTPGTRTARRRRAVVAGAFLPGASGGAAAFAAGPASGVLARSSSPTGHVLHLSFLEDPGQPPDPNVYYAGEGLLLTRNLYQGLVRYEPGTAQRHIEPELATSWNVSPNGLVYTFQLRKGVHFHDGTVFTSAAVAPSFARRAAVGGGPAHMVADVASVRTEGLYGVRITLEQENSAFLDYLASAYGPVMESPTALAAHAGKDHDQTYLQTHDVGTGPYTLTEAKVGVAYQLKAFPGYWGKKPYFTSVDLPVIDDLSTEEIQFNDGQIAAILHDLTAPAITSYEHDKSVDQYTLPTLESEVVYVNEHQGFLTSRSARLAMLEAIDLKAIDAAVFPDGAIVPPQFGPAHVLPADIGKQTIAYDTKPLHTLVDKLASSQRTLTVGYDTGAPDDQLIAENIAAELQGDGLTTKVVGYETSEIFGWVGSVHDAEAQAPNILVDYFWPDADNPYTWTHISYDPSGGLEYLSCQAPGVAALDSQAVASGSTSLYGKVVTAAQATGCWLNVADRDDVMVAQPWLKGIAAADTVASPESLDLSALYAS